MTAALYRIYDADGVLLYIGASVQPSRRLLSHRSQTEWWDRVAKITLEHFPTREELLDAEGKAIQAEDPLLNERRRGRSQGRSDMPISVRLEPEQREALRRIALTEHRSVNGQLRHLINERIAADRKRAA